MTAEVLDGRSRAAGRGAGLSGTFDSIVNRGEYFSNHYLSSLIQGDLAGLRKQWDEIEGKEQPTARTRVRALSRDFFAAKARVTEGVSADHGADVRALHDVVLTALGFTGPDGKAPERRELHLVRGGAEEVAVPAAHAVSTHTGLLLVALDLGFATSVDNALDPEGAGALLVPMTVENGRTRVRDLGDAVAHVFACEGAPRYVLLLAGGVIVLADRGKWAEGRFLAADLDLALNRRDTRSKGELETIAALFSSDALVPAEDRSVLETLTEASQKHAVGVSKDLREGIRRSVEILANEVIEQRIAHKQRVYDVPGLAGNLTKECLRFLYRLLFLLYAEARPELGILPVDAREYVEGYGLDRLRDLAMADLTTDHARNGRHLHESLRLLFRLVNDGYHHGHTEQSLEATAEDVGMVFEPLHSELFSPKATELLDRHPLRNEALQQVLKLLLLSKERRGQDRGFVSYAQLGVNQLGAVYEGLMAYTGFFAELDQFEVARPGQEDKGTWMVPASRADDYDEQFFVTRANPDTGIPERILHRRGSFVYRLSGRERQRSASYYTPEILTRTVVKHALAELLDQDGEKTPARKLLDLTICEPALGSGAFLNEAINQLAEEYLKRREAEVKAAGGNPIAPDDFAHERQKVKAHIALHQCYGVDLNNTAVELAEVSLWLNAMHKGLQAPWFGLHLRRGNSLVGARRATYRRDQLARRAWLKAAPKDRKLSDGPIGKDEIHHFLLPADGWASVVDTKQAKELRPENVKKLKAWKSQVTKTPSDSDARRLVALARRVEELWALARQRLELAERGLRRNIGVWGANGTKNGTQNGGNHVAEGRDREQIRAALEDPDKALRRLRLAMEAWCALWFWPIDGKDGMPEPPTMGEWISTLEALLGVKLGVGGEDGPEGQLDLLSGLESLDEQERRVVDQFGMLPTLEVIQRHDWLLRVIGIAGREGFWHWELEFAHIFAKGGFDLQVGNPPWVRPIWEDNIVLAEVEPWFGLTDRIPVEEFEDRRTVVLDQGYEADYLGELSSWAGLEIISSPIMRPLLAGVQTNLYMVFMDTVWRNLAATGAAGLLHPEGHFSDPGAGRFREATYSRLRRHFQFFNSLLLFEDIGHRRPYGIHIYGPQELISFYQISYLLHPEIIDGSMDHDGSGDLPTVQHPSGGWDLRPHKKRVVKVDEDVLGSWARMFDVPGTNLREARLLRPITTVDLQALRVLAEYPARIADWRYRWTSGFHERGAQNAGIIRWDTRIPHTWGDEVILQGPHFSVATLFAKQPNENCRSRYDYSEWDLERLTDRAVPRVNYQRAIDRGSYEAEIAHWEGIPSTRRWRVVWRRMSDPTMERSLHAALLPPGPTHVHTVHSMAGAENSATATWSGLWATLPYDYLVKVSGKADIQDEMIRRFPAPRESPYFRPLLLRTLRLNSLTRDYAPLWEELYDQAWLRDSWTDPDSTRPALNDVAPEWSMSTPLRTDYDRRMALVELDALAALILGLTAEQLCAMYRTQFPVLRKYEYEMWFDANGRKVPKDVVKVKDDPGADLGRYQLPFVQPNREKEMTRAYEEFRRRLG